MRQDPQRRLGSWLRKSVSPYWRARILRASFSIAVYQCGRRPREIGLD